MMAIRAAIPRSLSLYPEAESSDTIIMPIVVTEATNFEEQLTSMKVTFDRISKESVERNAHINSQND